MASWMIILFYLFVIYLNLFVCDDKNTDENESKKSIPNDNLYDDNHKMENENQYNDNSDSKSLKIIDCIGTISFLAIFFIVVFFFVKTMLF